MSPALCGACVIQLIIYASQCQLFLHVQMMVKGNNESTGSPPLHLESGSQAGLIPISRRPLLKIKGVAGEFSLSTGL